MGRKKKVSEIDILSMYMEFVSKHATKPISIADFAKDYNFKETDFYLFFDSFKTLEKRIFKTLFTNSTEILMKSNEFAAFDNRNKLLSTYYTLFENFNLNRDFIEIVLSGFENKLKALSVLSELKKSFTLFLDEIEIHSSILKMEALQNIQQKTIKEIAWLQLLLSIQFWLEDTSEEYHKTDVYIEKTINTTFDFLDNTFLKSALDLGKFLYKEKIQKNSF